MHTARAPTDNASHRRCSSTTPLSPNSGQTQRDYCRRRPNCSLSTSSLLSAPSLHRPPALLSERPVNASMGHSPHHAKMADVLRSDYYWSPLHTSCALAVIAEHEALLRCHPHTPQQQQRWQRVVSTRGTALRQFIAEHKAFYGAIDAEPLSRIEGCAQRLEACLLPNTLHQITSPNKNDVSTFVPFAMCQEREDNLAEVGGRHGKHISFADPLRRLVPTPPPVLECVPQEEWNVALGISAQHIVKRRKGRQEGQWRMWVLWFVVLITCAVTLHVLRK